MLLSRTDRVEQGLPLLFQLLQQPLHLVVFRTVLISLLLQVELAFLRLAQPLFELLTLFLKRGQGGLQLLAAGAALALLLNPGA